MKKKEKLGKTQYTNQVSRVEGGGGKMNEINERGNEEKIQRKTKKKLGKVKKRTIIINPVRWLKQLPRDTQPVKLGRLSNQTMKQHTVGFLLLFFFFLKK